MFHIKRGDNPPFFAWQGRRELLGDLFKELGYTIGAEIGVERGIFSATLCQKNPNLHLKCVDPWEPYFYYTQTSEETVRVKYEEAKRTLAPYNVEIVRKTSMDAVKEFKDGSLDFVYIDGLHDFDNVMLDLIHWGPKVRPGGIISGHDYCAGYMVGVVPAVDTYTRAHNVKMYYITREREPSFFWVKE